MGGKAPKGYWAFPCTIALPLSVMPSKFFCHALSVMLTVKNENEQHWVLSFSLQSWTCLLVPPRKPLPAIGVQPQYCCCSREAPVAFSCILSSSTSDGSWAQPHPTPKTLQHAGDIAQEPGQPNCRAQGRRTSSRKSFWALLCNYVFEPPVFA